MQPGRLCTQSRDSAPRLEAEQHHARPVWRDAGDGLGSRQGDLGGGVERDDHRRSSGAERTSSDDACGMGNGVVTLDGQTVGTPAFMSPEQAAGRLDALGTRERRLQPGGDLVRAADGPEAVSAARPSRFSWTFSRAGSRRRAPSSRRCPRRSKRSACGRWPSSLASATTRRCNLPRTSNAGWPTSRSRPGTIPGSTARGAGFAGTSRSWPAAPPPLAWRFWRSVWPCPCSRWRGATSRLRGATSRS